MNQQIEILKSKLEFVTSEGTQIFPGNYQKEKQKIEKKNKRRYWDHIFTFSTGTSIWRNKNYFLIIEDFKESIYTGKELPQITFLNQEQLDAMVVIKEAPVVAAPAPPPAKEEPKAKFIQPELKF